MSYRRINSIVAVLFLGLLLSLAGGCSSNDGADMAAETEPQVEVLIAEPVERPLVQSYPGRLASFRKAEVRARAAGILLRRHYIEGSDVAAGQLLFSIEDDQLRIDVEAAESALAKAEAEHQGTLDTLKRHQNLVEKQSINEHDYVASQTAEKKARAEVANALAVLDQAKLDLSYAQVTAPISGRAGLALVSEGALVGQNELTKMTVIEQLDPIYLDFSQPASDLALVADGVRSGRLKKIEENEIKIWLAMADGSRYEHPGSLIFTDSSVNQETDKVAMRAVFPNPDRILLPGGYLRVSLARAVNPAVFLAPRDSLIRQGNESWLLLLSPDNVVEKVKVETEEMDEKNWVVTSGLNSGDRIILSGSKALPLEGQKVAVAAKPGQSSDEVGPLAARKE